MPVFPDVLLVVARQRPYLLTSTIGHRSFQGKPLQQPSIRIGEKSGAIIVHLEDSKKWHVFFVHYYAPRGTEPHVRLHGVLHLEVLPENRVPMWQQIQD
jgi:hypothetical protein